MRRLFAFYLFLFKTRLAKSLGAVVLAVGLAAAYVGQRVKVYALLRENSALENRKEKLEENIAYLEEETARLASLEVLEPKAFALDMSYPRLGQLGRLPLSPPAEDDLWQRGWEGRGFLARLEKNLPFREAEVAAHEFKNAK